MSRILVLFTHPALEKSRVQTQLLKTAYSVEGVDVHDLYQEYPDFIIDVERERRLLIAHDIILYQHPLYWYSAPALLKEWQDLVLQYGFAYGRNGSALKGKVLGNVISAGGSKRSYHSGRVNRYSLRELLRPFEQSAALCGMRYLPPFAVHKTHDLSRHQIEHYSAEYKKFLQHLLHALPDEKQTESMDYINDWAKGV